jgi:hypothetical protein
MLQRTPLSKSVGSPLQKSMESHMRCVELPMEASQIPDGLRPGSVADLAIFQVMADQFAAKMNSRAKPSPFFNAPDIPLAAKVASKCTSKSVRGSYFTPFDANGPSSSASKKYIFLAAHCCPGVERAGWDAMSETDRIYYAQHVLPSYFAYPDGTIAEVANISPDPAIHLFIVTSILETPAASRRLATAAGEGGSGKEGGGLEPPLVWPDVFALQEDQLASLYQLTPEGQAYFGIDSSEPCASLPMASLEPPIAHAPPSQNPTGSVPLDLQQWHGHLPPDAFREILAITTSVALDAATSQLWMRRLSLVQPGSRLFAQDAPIDSRVWQQAMVMQWGPAATPPIPAPSGESSPMHHIPMSSLRHPPPRGNASSIGHAARSAPRPQRHHSLSSSENGSEAEGSEGDWGDEGSEASDEESRRRETPQRTQTSITGAGKDTAPLIRNLITTLELTPTSDPTRRQQLDDAIAGLATGRGLFRDHNGGLRVNSSADIISRLHSPEGLAVPLPGGSVVSVRYPAKDKRKDRDIEIVYLLRPANDGPLPTAGPFFQSQAGAAAFFAERAAGILDDLPNSLTNWDTMDTSGMLRELREFSEEFLRIYERAVADDAKLYPPHQLGARGCHHISIAAGMSLLLLECLYTGLMPATRKGWQEMARHLPMVSTARMPSRFAIIEVLNEVTGRPESPPLYRMGIPVQIGLHILGFRCYLCDRPKQAPNLCLNCRQGREAVRLTFSSPKVSAAAAAPLHERDELFMRERRAAFKTWGATQNPPLEQKRSYAPSTYVLFEKAHPTFKILDRPSRAAPSTMSPGSTPGAQPLTCAQLLRALENAQHLVEPEDGSEYAGISHSWARKTYDA